MISLTSILGRPLFGKICSGCGSFGNNRNCQRRKQTKRYLTKAYQTLQKESFQNYRASAFCSNRHQKD